MSVSNNNANQTNTSYVETLLDPFVGAISSIPDTDLTPHIRKSLTYSDTQTTVRNNDLLYVQYVHSNYPHIRQYERIEDETGARVFLLSRIIEPAETMQGNYEYFRPISSGLEIVSGTQSLTSTTVSGTINAATFTSYFVPSTLTYQTIQRFATNVGYKVSSLLLGDGVTMLSPPYTGNMLGVNRPALLTDSFTNDTYLGDYQCYPTSDSYIYSLCRATSPETTNQNIAPATTKQIILPIKDQPFGNFRLKGALHFVGFGNTGQFAVVEAFTKVVTAAGDVALRAVTSANYNITPADVSGLAGIDLHIDMDFATLNHVTHIRVSISNQGAAPLTLARAQLQLEAFESHANGFQDMANVVLVSGYQENQQIILRGITNVEAVPTAELIENLPSLIVAGGNLLELETATQLFSKASHRYKTAWNSIDYRRALGSGRSAMVGVDNVAAQAASISPFLKMMWQFAKPIGINLARRGLDWVENSASSKDEWRGYAASNVNLDDYEDLGWITGDQLWADKEEWKAYSASNGDPFGGEGFVYDNEPEEAVNNPVQQVFSDKPVMIPIMGSSIVQDGDAARRLFLLTQRRETAPLIITPTSAGQTLGKQQVLGFCAFPLVQVSGRGKGMGEAGMFRTAGPVTIVSANRVGTLEKQYDEIAPRVFLDKQLVAGFPIDRFPLRPGYYSSNYYQVVEGSSWQFACYMASVTVVAPNFFCTGCLDGSVLSEVDYKLSKIKQASKNLVVYETKENVISLATNFAATQAIWLLGQALEWTPPEGLKRSLLPDANLFFLSDLRFVAEVLTLQYFHRNVVQKEAQQRSEVVVARLQEQAIRANEGDVKVKWTYATAAGGKDSTILRYEGEIPIEDLEAESFPALANHEYTSDKLDFTFDGAGRLSYYAVGQMDVNVNGVVTKLPNPQNFGALSNALVAAVHATIKDGNLSALPRYAQPILDSILKSKEIQSRNAKTNVKQPVFNAFGQELTEKAPAKVKGPKVKATFNLRGNNKQSQPKMRGGVAAPTMSLDNLNL